MSDEPVFRLPAAVRFETNGPQHGTVSRAFPAGEVTPAGNEECHALEELVRAGLAERIERPSVRARKGEA